MMAAEPTVRISPRPPDPMPPSESSPAELSAPADAPPARGARGNALQLRGGTFTMIVLRLEDPKDPRLFAAIADKVAQAPNFFRHAPVVVDLQDCAAHFNIAELGRRLRQHQLVLVGVQNGADEQNRAAVNAGLCLFPDGRKAALDAARPVAEPAPVRPAAVVEPPPADGVTRAARLQVQGVRSGQQVYAQGGDLVVMGTVSPGAEVLADGHVHIYGALRGRALAGVSGDRKARIFCRSLEPDLVSVAGFWRVRDNIAEDIIGKPAQVALDGDRLTIEPLA